MLTKQQMWDIAFKTLGGEYENYRQEKMVVVMEDGGDVAPTAIPFVLTPSCVEALYEALKLAELKAVVQDKPIHTVVSRDARTILS